MQTEEQLEEPTSPTHSDNTMEKIGTNLHNLDHITTGAENAFSHCPNQSLSKSFINPGLNYGGNGVVEPGCRDVPACFVPENEGNICDKHMTAVRTYRAYVIRSDTYPRMNYIATKLYSDGSNVPSVRDWLVPGASLNMVSANGPFLIYYTHNQVIPANPSVLLYADGREWNGEFIVFRCAMKDSRLVNMRTGDEKHSWAAVKQ
jgi:hypothetical protein